MKYSKLQLLQLILINSVFLFLSHRTFIAGYGTPPEERFSNLVIMIISLGLGIPLLIMIITGLYLCIRRMPKRQGDVYLSQ